jgi:hypothetical protein
MLDIDSELDLKLEALFEHIKASPPPPTLVDITTPAPSRKRRTLSVAAGLAAVAVVAASVTLFAVELGNHHGPAAQSPAAQSPVSRPGLPDLGASPPLPANYQVLIPVTIETGSANLPTFIPHEHYTIQSACIGSGIFEVVGADGTVIDSIPCSSPHGPVLTFGYVYGPNQDLGKPLTARVLVDPSSMWEILIVESASASTPPTLPAAWDTFTAPPGSKTLIAATKGTGTVTLPTFTPTERYYIVSICTGGGSMVISSQPVEGGPGSSSCLGESLSFGANDFAGPTGEVMGAPITLTVTAPASSNWEILVYETNQPDGT